MWVKTDETSAYTLTLPTIIERAPQPYVAARRAVTIPFDEAIGPAVSEVLAWLAAQGTEPDGPFFIKYNVIDMPRLEIEIGFPTSTLLPASNGIITGTLPAGRYQTLTYHGHYDELVHVTGMFQAWGSVDGVTYDSEPAPQGERFACRLEIYTNDMASLPPAQWETVLAVKLRD